MCGLYGGHLNLIHSDAANILHHRGPDQSGQKVLQDGQGRPFLFGNTRLNVVDHHDIHLPLEVDDAVISFNGEIYNWRDIAAELKSLGVPLLTGTDTEVALRAYLHWGPDCLKKFNGMFSIAIWQNHTLFLARDRLGKKPLFVMEKDNSIAFASELKGFQGLTYRGDEDSHDLNFRLSDETLFENIRNIRPGTYAILDSRSMHWETVTWWHFPDYDGSITHFDDAIDEFIELFSDACNIRCIADVPVTAFLSGGIDSTLIQLILKLDRTYTIQFDEFEGLIDEEPLVQGFAEQYGFDAQFVRPTESDLFTSIDDIAHHIEFPLGSTIFPLFCLSRQVRSDGYKVVLSGEGADELFNGYSRNEFLLQEDAIIQSHRKGAYKRLADQYFGTALSRLVKMNSRGGVYNPEMLTECFKNIWNNKVPMGHNISVVESLIYLPEKLIMADRMSMAHGVEVRNPFLDHRIIDFSTKLAPHLRNIKGRGKPILRGALERLADGQIPDITNRSEKHGMPAPVNWWLFKRHDFERRDWDAFLLQKFLNQLEAGVVGSDDSSLVVNVTS